MTKYIIPIENVPNQSFDVDLNDKTYRFEFITKGFFIYMNLFIDEVKKLDGIICLNNVNLIQYDDIGFKGKIYFYDTQGEFDPVYYGLGDRWILYYENGDE